MGNTTSSEAPRRTPHKLSKPRVGNPAASSSLLSPNASSSASTTGRFSNSYLVGSMPVSPTDRSRNDTTFAVPVVPGMPGEAVAGERPPSGRRSRRDSNRLSGLFRSKSSTSEAEGKRRSIGLPDSRLGDGLSRANSVAHTAGVWPVSGTDSLQPGNRGSGYYDPTLYGASRLLNPSSDRPPVPPLPKSANSNGAQEATDETWRNTPLQPTASAPISRVNSELSLYAPTRRRSIAQTPGVATRSPTTFQISAKSSFRMSHPPTPSDSRRNSLEGDRFRHLSMPPPPRPSDMDSPKRVATPCEADYKQLGGMMFGSLRIVNGTPAPSPGPERQVGGDHVEAPDYLTSKPDFVWNEFSSPFEKHDTDAGGELKIAHPKPTSSALSPLVATFPTELRDVPEVVLDKNRSASQEDKPAGIPLANALPFESTPTPADLQTTSKLNEHDDNLFDDELDSVEDASPAGSDLSGDVSTQRAIDSNGKHVPRMLREDSGFAPSSDTSRKPLSKVDSGYSSIKSLRSVHESIRKPRKARPGSSPSDQQGRTKGQDTSPEDPNTTIPSSKDNALPPRDTSMTHALPSNVRSDLIQNAHSPLLNNGGPAPLSASKTNESQARPNQAPRHAHSRSLDGPASPVASDASMSRQSGDKSIGKRGRLRRLLSGNRKSLPAAYPTHDITETVPPIPSDVNESLREHNGSFPTAPERLALRVEASKETLKTIISVESVDITPSDVPMDNPASTTAMETERRNKLRRPTVITKTQQRKSYQTMADSITQAANTFLPSRKSFPALKKKSSSFDVDDDGPDGLREDEVHVPSMESVRHIMGNSAFDQAFTVMEDRQTRNLSAGKRAGHSPRHTPHRDFHPPRPLKATASAPDLFDTGPDNLAPPMPEEYLQRRVKAPPVSMRTRSSKNLRAPPQQRPSRPQPTSTGMPAPMWAHPSRPPRRGSTPQPVTYAMLNPHAVQGERQLRHRISYDGHGAAQMRYSPLPHGQGYDGWAGEQRYDSADRGQSAPGGHQPGPRPGNRRHTTGGNMRAQDSPFRVLHSYNSPAYRGAPIWR